MAEGQRLPALAPLAAATRRKRPQAGSKASKALSIQGGGSPAPAAVRGRNCWYYAGSWRRSLPRSSWSTAPLESATTANFAGSEPMLDMARANSPERMLPALIRAAIIAGSFWLLSLSLTVSTGSVAAVLGCIAACVFARLHQGEHPLRQLRLGFILLAAAPADGCGIGRRQPACRQPGLSLLCSAPLPHSTLRKESSGYASASPSPAQCGFLPCAAAPAASSKCCSSLPVSSLFFPPTAMA